MIASTWFRAARILASVAFMSLASACLERRTHDDAPPSPGRCTSCHGSPNNPGPEESKAAPPRDLFGNESTLYPGVGAHALHLAASPSHAAIACTECHIVPKDVEAPGHMDTKRPAELVFGPLATTGERTPSYDAGTRSCGETYCHRESDAVWNRPRSSADACGSCHGLPPPAPHPVGEQCWACHSNVRPDRTFIDPSLHVNGRVDVDVASCTSCHGSTANPGTGLVQAAPPRDLGGHTSSKFAGVGAHATHLYASDTHGAVPCTECHLVPKDARDRGHADTPLPAEITFGKLAQQNAAPSYDAASKHCSDTYCHRDSDATWTAPRSSTSACGSCHGLPPPAPHPASANCWACHANVREDGTFVNPTLHINGRVEVQLGECSTCHGGKTSPAPPVDTRGNTEVSAEGVGAHAIHLAGGDNGRPLECGECHEVPSGPAAAAHVDGLPAEVVLGGVAASDSRRPAFNYGNLRCSSTWCHGPTNPSNSSPVWTSTSGRLACDSCHGLPPPAPHPQMARCSQCHSAVVADDDRTILDRSRHVDGTVDVVDLASFRCTSCHGSATPAPPRDTAGNIATTAPGVGAHQAHLNPGGRARAVLCEECHVVPATLDAAGHIDSLLPAEVTFSGVASAWSAKPTYSAGSCQATYCHGASFVSNRASGGSLTEPEWTKVDGSQRACGTCHALPPPAPHPQNADQCSTCHFDVDADRNFVHPEQHVNGLIELGGP